MAVNLLGANSKDRLMARDGGDGSTLMGEPQEVHHSVFRTRVRNEQGDFIYRGLLHRGQWIVDDHLFQGAPLLSGTTIVELIRAAFVDHIGTSWFVELRRVAFERPLFVADDGTEIEVQFTPAGAGESVEVRSRARDSTGDWLVNSTAFAARIDSAPTVFMEPQLAAEWPSDPGLSVFGGNYFQAGPRWKCVQTMTKYSESVSVRLKLPDDFHHDLDAYGLHPALLDGVARVVWSYTRTESVPYTYDAIRIYGPLGVEVLIQGKHRRVGSSDVFDMIFLDPHGKTLVEIEGYVMREIEASSLVRQVDWPNQHPHRELSARHRVNPSRVVVSDPGDLESIHLEEFAARPPEAGEVQIEIVAAGLNFRDVLAALGQMPDMQNGPVAPGGECSGIVRAVGEGVHHLKPGDKVVAVARSTFATHATTSIHGVASMPGNIDFEEAAGIPIVFLTVQYALNELAHLKRRERILIHAASGGVGLAALQLAKRAGAEVFATAGHPDKREYLKSLGVEHVMDSRSLAFAGEIRELTAGEGVDVVLNSLAGEFIPASLAVLRSHGRFLEIGKRDIYADAKLGLYPFRNNLSYSAIDLGKIIDERNPILPRMFDHLMDQFARGDLKPLPTSVIPIEKAREGFRRMAGAEHVGKIVFQVIEDISPDRTAAKLFRQKYGEGVPVKWGLEVFRRLLSSDETPPYVLAIGKAVGKARDSDIRPRSVGSGDRGTPDLETAYRAPSSELEKALSELWEKTLGIGPIGVDDDFFDLGGDSIEAIQIQHALSRDFKLRITNTGFLANPTIGALAKLIEKGPPEEKA